VAAELLESLEHSGRRDFLADLVAGIIAGPVGSHVVVIGTAELPDSTID
jgi:hypothetical protein